MLPSLTARTVPPVCGQMSLSLVSLGMTSPETVGVSACSLMSHTSSGIRQTRSTIAGRLRLPGVYVWPSPDSVLRDQPDVKVAHLVRLHPDHSGVLLVDRRFRCQDLGALAVRTRGPLARFDELVVTAGFTTRVTPAVTFTDPDRLVLNDLFKDPGPLFQMVVPHRLNVGPADDRVQCLLLIEARSVKPGLVVVPDRPGHFHLVSVLTLF